MYNPPVLSAGYRAGHYRTSSSNQASADVKKKMSQINLTHFLLAREARFELATNWLHLFIIFIMAWTISSSLRM